MVCCARKLTTSSVLSSSAYRPRQRLAPGCPSLPDVIRSTSMWRSRIVMLGVCFTRWISVCCTAAPVASVTCTMRRALCPPSRVRCRWPSSSEKGTPSCCSQATLSGACSTTKRVAAGSDRPAPAMKVSLSCESKLSLRSITAAMPPCAQPLEPSLMARLVRMATRCVGARCRAADRPARPLPTMRTSKSRVVGWLKARLRSLLLCGLVGEAHVDRRVGFRLGQLDQRFLGQFEHRDERHDQHGHALADVEQVLELHEAPPLQLLEHHGHVLAHRELFARDLVVLDQLGPAQDVAPGFLQVGHFHVREARLQRLLDVHLRAQHVAAHLRQLVQAVGRGL